MAVTLGKNIAVSGVSNARSVSVSNSATEIDCTSFADAQGGFRRYKKALVEQTCELECVDDPAVTIGGTFTLSGPTLGAVKYLVTNIVRSDPIDGIRTFTVSATRSV